MNRTPRVLILHATGTNRDREALLACERAGGQAEIVHVNQLRDGTRRLADYQMLVLPGGFSYGDDLGAGRLWASDLTHLLQDQVTPFIEAGKPVIGICNGFQALVKSGWLPGGRQDAAPTATLTYNASNRFECRWVWLEHNPGSPCVFTRGLTEPIFCPVAHGEGRFVPRDEETLDALERGGQVALRYTTPSGGRPAGYPHNPNGSVADIAGVCNPSGTVFGLMPHPEDHISPEQHPRWTRGECGNLGLALFENGIAYAGQV
jgi:phosphoribosylformylglycinamidine synthase